MDGRTYSFLIIGALWGMASSLGGSQLFLYFLHAGLSMTDIIFANVIAYFSPLILMLLLNGRTIDLRRTMIAGAVISALAYMLFAGIPYSREFFFATIFLLGSYLFLFWVPFNGMYFPLCKGREALMSSVYFAVFAVMSVIMPLVAGWIAASYGFEVLMLCTAIIYLLAAILMASLPKVYFDYKLPSCLEELRGYKLVNFFLGLYEGINWCSAIVVALIFFHLPQELGLFLSATAMFSIIGSLAVSALSDKSRKRSLYLNVFSIMLAISNIISVFASMQFLWFISSAVRYFFTNLFYPFTTAIVVDSGRDMRKAMIGREFVLNAGRVVGTLIVLAVAAYYSIMASFILAGLTLILYPLTLWFKRSEVKVE